IQKLFLKLLSREGFVLLKLSLYFFIYGVGLIKIIYIYAHVCNIKHLIFYIYIHKKMLARPCFPSKNPKIAF
ncbi:hypothetical protein ACJX0J_027943, partial [Zea mays]